MINDVSGIPKNPQCHFYTSFSQNRKKEKENDITTQRLHKGIKMTCNYFLWIYLTCWFLLQFCQQ